MKFLTFMFAIAAVKCDIQEILEHRSWQMSAVASNFYEKYDFGKGEPCSFMFNVTRTQDGHCSCGNRDAPLLRVKGPLAALSDGEYPFILLDNINEAMDARDLNCVCPQDNKSVKLLVTKITHDHYYITICVDKVLGTVCVPAVFTKSAPAIPDLQATVNRLVGVTTRWKRTCSQP